MTAWIDELDLGRPASWPAMGVRADDQPWPEPAGDGVLALRRTILDAHPECVAALPGSHDAVAEVAALVGVDGLAAAAVAQGDDFCVLAPGPGRVLTAGAVLFPSHWRLADKIGRPLADVHSRVPGYPAGQVDRFVDRLRPGQVVWRRNLLVHRDGELHAPDPSPAEVPVDRWWLRSERQTLRVLPVTGAVLFTIHTDTERLAALPIQARRDLASRLEALPPTWAPYAGVGADLPDLIAWLAQ